MSRFRQVVVHAIYVALLYNVVAAAVVSSHVPDLEVLCGQYSVFCASSCQTYQKQCAPTFGEIGATNNNIPPFPVITGNNKYGESNTHVQETVLNLHLQPPPEHKQNCKGKNAACSTNNDCCLEFFCKHHKQQDGHLAKIGTCQIPFYLDKIVPRSI